VAHLEEAKKLTERAACSYFRRVGLTKKAIEKQKSARAELQTFE
jgi:hypothetical protein